MIKILLFIGLSVGIIHPQEQVYESKLVNAVTNVDFGTTARILSSHHYSIPEHAKALTTLETILESHKQPEPWYKKYKALFQLGIGSALSYGFLEEIYLKITNNNAFFDTPFIPLLGLCTYLCLNHGINNMRNPYSDTYQTALAIKALLQESNRQNTSHQSRGLRVIRAQDSDFSKTSTTLREIYLNAFSQVYAQNWSETLAQSINKGFNKYIERFKQTDNMALFVTEHEQKISGWILFEIDKEKKQAIIELIAIDPAYWRTGLGKKLVFALKQHMPEIKTLFVCTRKINLISPPFYEALGFKKSNFSLPEYAQENMQGYTLEL
jgi:N-acetylglutamate synthase-like GNAT family acetyltransferase